MALLQISETGSASPAQQGHKRAAGIDLGTTNSLVATVVEGRELTLADGQGRHLLPSVVHYSNGDHSTVGSAALERAFDDPLNTIASVKRFMGRGLEDVQQGDNTHAYELVAGEGGMPRIRTVAGDLSPVEISAEILRDLRARAEQQLGGALDGVVITVPAYFDDAQRQATKDAARLAGLQVMRLLNEPTAAAVAYGLDRAEEGVHAIYDLGGGTFDVSILRFSRGVFEVLATAGDSALGGDDLDQVIARWLLQQAGIGAEVDTTLQRRVMDQAKVAKEALSDAAVIDLSLMRPDGSRWEGALSRETLNTLIDPLIRRTLAPCRRVLRDAGVGREEICEVVMVGGSTRIPRVRELVGEFFACEPHVDIDPDRVVAIGAAIQADMLVGNKPDDEMLLLDVNPLSLGIETMGGLVEKVIPRNTTIPVSRAQEFTTFKDGQTAMVIHVLQGERELVADNRSLARFELHGIPPMVAGAARIQVSFQVDADGLLNVSARELSTGVEGNVEIKPAYGLTDAEIERMLRDSQSHARDDVDVRRLRELQVDADRNSAAVVAALARDGDRLLSSDERRVIDEALAALEKARAGEDPRTIRQALEILDQATADFAARRMDAGIRTALSGHRLDEFTGA